jgi:hypothetical protein
MSQGTIDDALSRAIIEVVSWAPEGVSRKDWLGWELAIRAVASENFRKADLVAAFKLLHQSRRIELQKQLPGHESMYVMLDSWPGIDLEFFFSGEFSARLLP